MTNENNPTEIKVATRVRTAVALLLVGALAAGFFGGWGFNRWSARRVPKYIKVYDVMVVEDVTKTCSNICKEAGTTCRYAAIKGQDRTGKGRRVSTNTKLPRGEWASCTCESSRPIGREMERYCSFAKAEIKKYAREKYGREVPKDVVFLRKSSNGKIQSSQVVGVTRAEGGGLEDRRTFAEYWGNCSIQGEYIDTEGGFDIYDTYHWQGGVRHYKGETWLPI